MAKRITELKIKEKEGTLKTEEVTELDHLIKDITVRR
jgi:hypothetical protein